MRYGYLTLPDREPLIAVKTRVNLNPKTYQNVLESLRSNCTKYGAQGVYLQKINNGQFLINGANWEDPINLSRIVLLNLTQTGHFRLTSKKDPDSIENDSTEDLILSNYILNKKFGKNKMLKIAPILTLAGGLLVLIMSLVFYLLGANSTGYINYTNYGNFAGRNTINWFHMLLIGLFLIATSIFLYYLNTLEEEEE